MDGGHSNFGSACADTAPPHYAAEDLTEGGRRATISLNGKVYTLQITRQGKLLLTK